MRPILFCRPTRSENSDNSTKLSILPYPHLAEMGNLRLFGSFCGKFYGTSGDFQFVHILDSPKIAISKVSSCCSCIKTDTSDIDLIRRFREISLGHQKVAGRQKPNVGLPSTRGISLPTSGANICEQHRNCHSDDRRAAAPAIQSGRFGCLDCRRACRFRDRIDLQGVPIRSIILRIGLTFARRVYSDLRMIISQRKSRKRQ